MTEQVFGRVEYRYTDFGSKDYTINGETAEADFAWPPPDVGRRHEVLGADAPIELVLPVPTFGSDALTKTE